MTPTLTAETNDIIAMKTHLFESFWKAFGRIIAALLTMVAVCRAQWTTQTITLNPGWNAVFLEIQPEPASGDTVFAGIPVDSAWDWLRAAPIPQFIQDANTLVPQNPEWATYFLPAHPKRFLRNLFDIRGGRPLLVNLTGSASVQWTIRGRPVRPTGDWVPGTYNLTGFYVQPGASISLTNYFAASTAHANRLVSSLNAAGTWAIIPNSTVIQRGKAYWVQTVGPSNYTGPMTVDLDRQGGIDFGTSMQEMDVTVGNASSSGNRTVTLRLLSSDAKPAGATNFPAVAGPVALSYRDFQTVSATDPLAPWVPMTGDIALVVPALSQRVVRLSIRRSDLAGGGAFASLLEVSESGGTRQLIPITAQKGSTAAPVPGLAQGSAAPPPPSSTRSGLWAGAVKMDGVSWAGDVSTNIHQANPAFDGSDRTTPRAISSDFQFRVIFHVDAAGTTRLLQKVMQVWQNGTLVADPLNPGKFLPGTPGRYRLFTDEDVAANYVGTNLRDGKLVARRISTPVFALHQPLAMSGAFGTNSVSATVTTGYDDPLNPFKHSFHPEHDNWNASYSQKLPAGVESFDISRDVRLDFTASNPFGPNSPQWGDTELGGNYFETVRGVHARPIYVKGKFTVVRVSDVSQLD